MPTGWNGSGTKLRAETETALGEYHRLEAELLREQDGHQRTRRWLARLGIAVAVLVVLLAVTVLGGVVSAGVGEQAISEIGQPE